MVNRSLKTKLRRVIRKQKQQVEEIGSTADEQINRHLFRRLTRLVKVKRFVISWLGLMLLLGIATTLQFSELKNTYEKATFTAGGTLNEGIVGGYTNSNPIYATNAVDSSVSKLIFAGLLRYDGQNKLVPDLAEKLDIDSSEKVYTVTLRENLYWHDGKPLTAEDAAFTFNTIKNPDARSYLQPSWEGIKVEAKDQRTVVFTLKDTLSPFPHSLTTGIIPAHILKDISPDRLRSNDFNTVKPVGSGPFRFEVVEVRRSKDQEIEKRQQIGLLPFEKYHHGPSKLSRYVIKTYTSQEQLEKAYNSKEIGMMAGLFTPPEGVANDTNNIEYSIPLAGQVMVFFKTSQGVLSDPAVRKALVLGTNRNDVLSSVGYTLTPIDGPLLKSHVGYDKSIIQKTNNIEEAKAALEQAGWKVDPESGLRKKDDKLLKFRLNAEATGEYTAIAQSLQKHWREIGADLEVKLEKSDDLKNTVSSHNYESLLHAISTGADPDVFAYWHSSQMDVRSKTRLNFSEYKSNPVDEALQGGRSRSDPSVRALKYKPFLENWTKDNPALALYQPRFVFITRSPFTGFSSSSVVSPIDRYTDVEKWLVRQVKQ